MAARPIAAAVLRPTGSARTCDAGMPRNSRRTAAACSTFVTAQILRGVTRDVSRAIVSRSMVSRPTMFRSCFGVRIRLRGQKRVPRPPARSTAQTGNDFALMLLFSGADDFIGVSRATLLLHSCLAPPAAHEVRPNRPARTSAAATWAQLVRLDTRLAPRGSSRPAQAQNLSVPYATVWFRYLQEI